VRGGRVRRANPMAATRSRPRRSVIARVPVDRRAARIRHPDVVALDAGVKLAAVLMLMEEGLERVE
jgi:hypothetical protein